LSSIVRQIVGGDAAARHERLSSENTVPPKIEPVCGLADGVVSFKLVSLMAVELLQRNEFPSFDLPSRIAMLPAGWTMHFPN
jgi:hypothetical protein